MIKVILYLFLLNVILDEFPVKSAATNPIFGQFFHVLPIIQNLR